MVKKYKINKTYREINEKIKSGNVVVVTAEEIIDIVKQEGAVEAARHVDVVTTGTFSPMCSSGAFINFGQSVPSIRASKVWLNKVPAYAGLAAVDCFIGATELCEDDPLNKVYPGEFNYGGGHVELCEDDPLNKVYPGEFNYGGGHVIQELVAKKKVHLKAASYGTSCYPNQMIEKDITLRTIPNAVLCNPRNGYQNYNCAVNLTKKTVYTYMGTLKPKAGNANYCSAGQLSPLLNDPYYETIGLGTRIFLGGAAGYVTWHGTQHNPSVKRTKTGVPVSPAGTIWVMGDLKKMSPKWLVGVSIQGYGLFTQIVDYGYDYPNGISKTYGQVNYAELKSGSIKFKGETVQAVPLSSVVKAREIAETLKNWISKGKFTLCEPQFTLPKGSHKNDFTF